MSLIAACQELRRVARQGEVKTLNLFTICPLCEAETLVFVQEIAADIVRCKKCHNIFSI